MSPGYFGCKCGNPDWPGTCPGWRNCPLCQPEPVMQTRTIWQCPECKDELDGPESECCMKAQQVEIEEEVPPDDPLDDGDYAYDIWKDRSNE